MEKDSKNVVCIEEVDGMPFINRSIVRQIMKGGMVFMWDGCCFRAKRVECEIWDVCWECDLQETCNEKIRKICKALDYYLGDIHKLEK